MWRRFLMWEHSFIVFICLVMGLAAIWTFERQVYYATNGYVATWSSPNSRFVWVKRGFEDAVK